MTDAVAPTPRHEWRQDAACLGHDPELYLPAGRGHAPVEALRTCLRCPVRMPCLQEALAREPGDDVGVWGGTTERQRHDVRRGRLTVDQALARGEKAAGRRTDVELARGKASAAQPAIDRRKALELRKARRILREVAFDHGVAAEDVLSGSRFQHVVAARHDAIRHIVARCDLSLSAVGRLLGMDHTTVAYVVRKGISA